MSLVYAVTCTGIALCTVELEWLEQLWNHENMFKTGEVRANEHSARSEGIIGISFPFSLT